MKKLLFALGVALWLCAPAHAQTQSAVVVSQCGTPPASYVAGQPYPLTMDTNGNLCGSGVVSVSAVDPCISSAITKASVPITIATATTTQLVAPSGTKAVYICGGVFTIAPSATSADTALIEYGTSTNCTGTHALTGTFGNGDLTSAAPPVAINLTGELNTPASQGVCVVTTGTAVSVQGYITYVQQ